MEIQKGRPPFSLQKQGGPAMDTSGRAALRAASFPVQTLPSASGNDGTVRPGNEAMHSDGPTAGPALMRWAMCSVVPAGLRGGRVFPQRTVGAVSSAARFATQVAGGSVLGSLGPASTNSHESRKGRQTGSFLPVGLFPMRSGHPARKRRAFFRLISHNSMITGNL